MKNSMRSGQTIMVLLGLVLALSACQKNTPTAAPAAPAAAAPAPDNVVERTRAAVTQAGATGQARTEGGTSP